MAFPLPAYSFVPTKLVRVSKLILCYCAVLAVASASSIFQTAEDGDAKTLQQLLREDPKLLNTQNEQGMTALHTATLHGRTNIVKLLLESGAKSDVKDRFGGHPLRLAVLNGRMLELNLLLAAGADVNARDNDGRTPLTEAYNSEIANILRKHGAIDPVTKNEPQKTTPATEQGPTPSKSLTTMQLIGKIMDSPFKEKIAALFGRPTSEKQKAGGVVEWQYLCSDGFVNIEFLQNGAVNVNAIAPAK